jgi:hypothetical protein
MDGCFELRVKLISLLIQMQNWRAKGPGGDDHSARHYGGR